MSWTVATSEMLLELRRRFGTRRSTSLTDAVLIPFLNSGIAEVHHLIAEHNPDFLVTSSDLTTTANVATVALPADFYKGRRVDLVSGSSVTRLRPFQIEEETYLAASSAWDAVSTGPGRPRYMFQAGNIRFVPVPSSVYTVRPWYIPHATKLALGTKASLDIDPHTTNCSTVVEASSDGEAGNDITLAFVADGTGAGTLNEAAYPVLVFHYQTGVTTVANFEAAVAVSTYLDVKLPGASATLASPGDTFSASALAGGVDEVTYNGVNGHEDLVYEHALRLCKVRDRMPTQEHDMAIARLEKRLLSALGSRDQSEPEYLPDLAIAEDY